MQQLNRRKVLGAAFAGAAAVACSTEQVDRRVEPSQSKANARTSPTSAVDVHSREARKKGLVPVRTVFDLPKGRPWRTQDPFLFCVHHNDRYPRGNGQFGPAASLSGRRMGQDFQWKDGWNMYHGRTVPGFPEHPHRGFETVTVVREGRLDHADSLGAIARYGDGDVQWLTAGAGIQHAEMFPLLDKQKDNPLDLFQIWLNLPGKNKMVAPQFSMLWANTIPKKVLKDERGRVTQVSIRAGNFAGVRAPSPPPHSWASDPENAVGIWTAEVAPLAQFRLPKAKEGVQRSIYFLEGSALSVGGRRLKKMQGAELDAAVDLLIENGPSVGEVLILQGRPIGEPVVRRGPFVMNTQSELSDAFLDFRRTRFGGWPWDNPAPVHGYDPARFARRVDGKIERPG